MNNECCTISFSGLHGDLPAMGLDYIIAQAESQHRPLPGRLGGKKRLEYLVHDLPGNAIAIISYMDFYFVVRSFCAYGNPWRIACSSRFLFFTDRVKRIVVQIQQHPAYVLGDDVDFANARVKVCLHLRVEGIVLSP